MADVFSEVDEQLRSARYQSIVRRGWPYAAALVIIALLAVVGVWVFNRQQQGAQAQASETYAEGLQALGANDTKGSAASFGAIARSAPRGYKTLALMQQAGLRLKLGKKVEALQLLDEAARVAPDQVMADAARLKAGMLAMDDHPLAEVEQRLQPLTGENRPFRQQARESLALARLAAGRTAEARGDFQVLSLSQDVGDSARARAKYVLALIDSGSAAVLPAAVKAAAALPPPPPTPSPLPPQLAPQAGAAQ